MSNRNLLVFDILLPPFKAFSFGSILMRGLTIRDKLRAAKPTGSFIGVLGCLSVFFTDHDV
jgi:hypothetical protein